MPLKGELSDSILPKFLGSLITNSTHSAANSLHTWSRPLLADIGNFINMVQIALMMRRGREVLNPLVTPRGPADSQENVTNLDYTCRATPNCGDEWLCRCNLGTEACVELLHQAHELQRLEKPAKC